MPIMQAISFTHIYHLPLSVTKPKTQVLIRLVQNLIEVLQALRFALREYLYIEKYLYIRSTSVLKRLH